MNVVKESVCTDWPKDDDDSPGVDSRDVRMGVDALDDQDLSAESAATELKDDDMTIIKKIEWFTSFDTITGDTEGARSSRQDHESHAG